jgi:hypothetical protein
LIDRLEAIAKMAMGNLAIFLSFVSSTVENLSEGPIVLAIQDGSLLRARYLQQISLGPAAALETMLYG